MIMKIFVKTVLSALVTCSLISGCAAVANMSDDHVVEVNHATWQQHKQVNIDELLSQPIPDTQTSLIFIRSMDDDAEQTGVNLSINDRFQVSLHPGNFTQVYTCSGTHKIGSNITELKTNNLMFDTQQFELSGGQAYFFNVDVDRNKASKINLISEAKAKQELAGKSYQKHQISRVVANCPPSQSAAVPPPAPVPVLKEKVRMQLQIQFDNDQAVVKPKYFDDIQELAMFMKKYADTQTVIEGHTDSNASERYNQKLSQRRANAVKDILSSRYGISADRLTAIGYGELRPVATNATAEGRQKNRRVVADIEQVE